VHLFLGAVFVLAGLGCLRYFWAGAVAFEREPPLLAFGVLLVGIGAGLALRTRAARVLAGLGLSGCLAAIAMMVVRLYVGVRPGDRPDDRLAAHVHLLQLALTAAGIVLLLLALRRVRSAPAFGALDGVPVGGVAAALAFGIVWVAGDDARLRPCRNGNDHACGTVAVALLESAERAPSAPPTRDEERAARVLTAHRCRADDRSLCGLQRYAAGTVDVRARRLDAAKEAFLWACDADRSWCARAAQEPVAWTAPERKRLGATLVR
jgi:hypothetical protein